MRNFDLCRFINYKIERFLYQRGYIHISRLNIAPNIEKRLDEHREVSEKIIKSGLMQTSPWSIGHLASTDEYLLTIYQRIYNTNEVLKHHKVRERPAEFGPRFPLEPID
jgi:hypothetical protein